MTDLRIVNLTDDLAAQCAALESLAFPHADPSDLLSEEDIRVYARTFPQGFFVALDDLRVVGQGAGIFLDFDFDQPQHTLADITGPHQCGHHNPAGHWYYGTDLIVHPDYRRQGIGRMLYEVRKDLVHRYHKLGIIAGAHMPGFADYKHEMTAEEYVAMVNAGELYDPTLTFQIGNGFRIVGVLKDYVHDEATDGYSALIVWDNPDHRGG